MMMLFVRPSFICASRLRASFSRSKGTSGTRMYSAPQACQLGSILGACAVTALLKGETGALIGMHRGRVRILPYEEAEKEPFRRDLYDLAVMLGATGME